MKPFHQKPINLFLLFLVFLLTTLKAFSQDSMYGIVGNYLVSINTTTGTATEIVQLSPTYAEMHRLAYVPSLDMFFTVVDWQTNPRLASIDRCTGEITIIGFIDQLSPPLDIKLIEGFTFNPDDGMLYAAGHETRPPANNLSSRLMTIDPLTANATVVANITGTCQQEADDLAFASGAYYAMDACATNRRIYSINISNGNTTFIGSNTSSASRTTVHPSTGVYYAGSPAERRLYTISTTNGSVTLIGQMYNPGDFGGGSLLGLAFAPNNDSDGDKICDRNDNCIITPNPSQTDLDADGFGDECDNCPDTPNTGQEDSDCDGVGNVCDLCPGGDDSQDSNNDGIPDCADWDGINNLSLEWRCGNNNDKVWVCHIPSEDPSNPQNICISPNAVPAHLAHGDYLGFCGSASCGESNLVAPPGNSSEVAQNHKVLALYPNPAESEFHLVFNEAIPENAVAMVVDMAGRTVLKTPLEAGDIDQTVTVAALPSGVYVVRVTVNDLSIWVEKFAKQ